VRIADRRFISQAALWFALTVSSLGSGCALRNVTALYPSGPATAGYGCLKSYDAPAVCMGAETSGKLNDAVECADTTRDAYGSFLLCREERQLWGGAFIGALAAGAAGVATAGISNTAAAALGATAGAGLAFDYATYNKAKSKAYADATVQLQCVETDVVPASSQFLYKNYQNAGPDSDLLDKYNEKKQAIDGTWVSLKDKYISIGKSSDRQVCQSELGDEYKRADSEMQEATLEIAQFTSLRYLTDARIELMTRRQDYVNTRYRQMSLDVIAAVKTIDVRAFATSQSGIPDADQIAKAVQAAGSAIPQAKAAPGGAPVASLAGVQILRGPAAHQCDLLRSALQDVQVGSERLKTTLQTATRTVDRISYRLSLFDQALAALRIPDGGFAECLTLKSFEQSASGNASSTSKSGASSGSGKSNSSGSQSGSNAQQSNNPSDSNSPSTAQKPSDIAFQVLPSDAVQIDPTKAPTATIKIVGGKPPYYWRVVDPGSIGVVQASQNALFVGLDVAPVGNADKGRLLLGDSAGADEVVYMSRAVTTDTSKNGSKGAGANQTGAIINYGTIKGK
jgi:hypothetical protein